MCSREIVNSGVPLCEMVTNTFINKFVFISQYMNLVDVVS